MNLRWNEEQLKSMVIIEVDYTEVDNGLLLWWHVMLQNQLKYYNVNAKKKSFGNDSSDAIKSCF